MRGWVGNVSYMDEGIEVDNRNSNQQDDEMDVRYSLSLVFGLYLTDTVAGTVRGTIASSTGIRPFT